MSGILKKLRTGTMLRTFNFDESNANGQMVTIRNNNGDYQNVVCIESVNCAQGTIDRIQIKKSVLESLGFTVIID